MDRACPGFKSPGAGSWFRACAVVLSPHAGSASSQCVISALGQRGLESHRGVGCRRRRRDGKNSGLSGYGSPARPGAELQSLEEETQPQAEPKEADEEAAEETRVAGRTRGYQPPHGELREGKTGAGEGARGRMFLPHWAARASGLTGHWGAGEGGGMRGAPGDPVEATGGLLGAKPRPPDRPGRPLAHYSGFIKWGKCSSA